MNAAEFASRLLDLIASAVPEEATISKRLEAQIDALLDEFATPPEPVLKLDEDRRMVYGWASVISKNGTPIIDRQGDVVTTDDLREAVHDFMKHRTAGEMHDQMGVGEVVESFVLDAAVQKSLGIDLGIEGWYVGVHVPNDEVWAKVKKGDYKAFSIGGSAVREAIPDAESAGYTVVKGYKTLGDGTPDGDAKCPKCGKKHSARGCMAKFNPNHGPDGRFASGGGMRGAGRSSRSAGPKLTGSAGPAKKKPAKGGSKDRFTWREMRENAILSGHIDEKGKILRPGTGGKGAKKAPTKGGASPATKYKNLLSLHRAVGEGELTTAHLKAARSLGVRDGSKMRFSSDTGLTSAISRAEKDIARAYKNAKDGGRHEGAIDEQYYMGIYDQLVARKPVIQRNKKR